MDRFNKQKFLFWGLVEESSIFKIVKDSKEQKFWELEHFLYKIQSLGLCSLKWEYPFYLLMHGIFYNLKEKSLLIDDSDPRHKYKLLNCILHLCSKNVSSNGLYCIQRMGSKYFKSVMVWELYTFFIFSRFCFNLRLHFFVVGDGNSSDKWKIHIDIPNFSQ